MSAKEAKEIRNTLGTAYIDLSKRWGKSSKPAQAARRAYRAALNLWSALDDVEAEET